MQLVRAGGLVLPDDDDGAEERLQRALSLHAFPRTRRPDPPRRGAVDRAGPLPLPPGHTAGRAGDLT